MQSRGREYQWTQARVTAPTGKSANNENNNIEYQWYGAHHDLTKYYFYAMGCLPSQ